MLYNRINNHSSKAYTLLWTGRSWVKFRVRRTDRRLVHSRCAHYKAQRIRILFSPITQPILLASRCVGLYLKNKMKLNFTKGLVLASRIFNMVTLSTFATVVVADIRLGWPSAFHLCSSNDWPPQYPTVLPLLHAVPALSE
jgi:hypothetical protein